MSWLRDGGTAAAQSDHLGDALAGLVDGHLDHDTRDHALAHLAHCGSCRAEAECLRRLRTRLLDLGARSAPVPVGLAARLMALEQVPLVPAPSLRSHPPLWVSGPVGASRPAGRPSSGLRPAAGPRPVRRPRVPRAAAAGAALVLGLGGVLAAVGPPAARPVRPSNTPAVNVQQVDLPTPGPRRQELVRVGPQVVLAR